MLGSLYKLVPPLDEPRSAFALSALGGKILTSGRPVHRRGRRKGLRRRFFFAKGIEPLQR
jgi:hypothetical protein